MMKKYGFVLGSAFWGAGFMVFGAFLFVMHRPLTVAPPEKMLRSMTPSTVTSSLVGESAQVVTLPQVEIVGAAPPLRFAPEVIAPTPPRDISQMNCDDWRPLQQGGAGSSVRECQ